MRINKERKSAESPDQAPHGKTRVSRRVLLAAILLTLLAGIAVPSGLLTKVGAAVQDAARRAGVAAPKSPKPARAVRQSKDSQIISESVTNPDGTITAGKIITDLPIQRTTE